MLWRPVIKMADKQLFDYIIEIANEIKSLKGSFNKSSQWIESGYINIKNDNVKLYLILKYGFDLTKICKIKNLYVNYFDTEDEQNNSSFRFESTSRVFTVFV
jgi:hypothetical protein